MFILLLFVCFASENIPPMKKYGQKLLEKTWLTVSYVVWIEKKLSLLVTVPILVWWITVLDIANAAIIEINYKFIFVHQLQEAYYLLIDFTSVVSRISHYTVLLYIPYSATKCNTRPRWRGIIWQTPFKPCSCKWVSRMYSECCQSYTVSDKLLR